MAVNPIYRSSYDFTYGTDPFEKGETFASDNYRINAGSIGLATDVRTAAQLQEVSAKLSTGAKTIEVSAINPGGQPILDAIPKQHFKEIERLKKLVGADITFHGPLIEPTGVTQGGWDEASRIQAEKQISDAVFRSHDLNPEGNTVVTLHTSNGIPAPSVRMNLFNQETGKYEEKTANIVVINETTGEMGQLPKRFLTDNYLTGEKADPLNSGLNRLNKDAWESKVSQISQYAMRGIEHIEAGLSEGVKIGADKEVDIMKQMYQTYCKDKKEYERMKEAMSKNPVSNILAGRMDSKIGNIVYGEGLIRDSYRELQEMFNQAKQAAEMDKKNGSQQLAKLEEYRKEAAEKLEAWKNDPIKIKEFAQEVSRGFEVCRGIFPRLYRPLEEFAIEKASETFGNVAFNAYKKFGDSAPIISIENPPVGMGLTRADEIRKLVVATQKHFVEKAMNDGLSQSEAEDQAQKLIGVTWDVGHINMIRKYGYGDKELAKETAQIKEFVKHIHLSDNFGLDHTELPMGMGNVPLKEHLKELGEKAEKAKKIVETGDWYQHFKTNPLSETLHALGSPIYPMQMQPYWNTASNMSGVPPYFAGYGFSPEGHHSIYGSGFSGLPTELGGQVQARGSRLGGTPME